MPWFASDEQKEQEAAALAAVRALSVEQLAADVLERVYGVADRHLTTNTAFGYYKTARSADLTAEDHPVFAEALQHLLNHRVIAIDGFYGTSSGHIAFMLTGRGRELLERGEHGSVLAG